MPHTNSPLKKRVSIYVPNDFLTRTARILRGADHQNRELPCHYCSRHFPNRVLSQLEASVNTRAELLHALADGLTLQRAARLTGLTRAPFSLCECGVSTQDLRRTLAESSLASRESAHRAGEKACVRSERSSVAKREPR